MPEVKIDKIIPVTDARDSFNKIIDEVDATDELYVITKNGKPAAIVVGVHHLDKLTGGKSIPDTISPRSTASSISTAPDPVPADLPKIELAPTPVAEPKKEEPLSMDELFGPIEKEETTPPVSTADPLANPYSSFKPTVSLYNSAAPAPAATPAVNQTATTNPPVGPTPIAAVEPVFQTPAATSAPSTTPQTTQPIQFTPAPPTPANTPIYPPAN